MAENPVLKKLAQQSTGGKPAGAGNTYTGSNPVLQKIAGVSEVQKLPVSTTPVRPATTPANPVQSTTERVDYEKEVSRLQELRRQAQVDLDANTVNRIDAELKELRASAGKQTVGDRVNDALSGAFNTGFGQTVNAGATLSADTEYNKRQIASLEKTLATGRTTDGKPINDAQRQKIEEAVAQMRQENADAASDPNSAVNEAQRAADRMSATGEEQIASAKAGLGKGGQFLVDAGVAGAQLAGDIGLSLLVPGAGMASMGVRAFGGAAQEARQAGATAEQQVAYGFGSAATSILVERIANIAGPFKKAFGSGVVDSLAPKLVSRLTGSALGKMALSALSEGGEEFIEAVFQPVLQQATYNRDASFDLEQALYDAAIGAALGVIGGGVDVATGGKTTRNPAGKAAGTQAVSSEGKIAPAKQVPVQAVSGGVLERETQRLFGQKNTAHQAEAESHTGRTTGEIEADLAIARQELQEAVDYEEYADMAGEWSTVSNAIDRTKKATAKVARLEAELVAALGASGQNKTAPEVGAEQITTQENIARYRSDIDEVFSGKYPSGKVVQMGETPSILLNYGAQQRPLTITQNAAYKIAYPQGYMGGKHNLGMSALKQLPYQIADPVAILKSASQDNSLVIVTAWKDGDTDVIAPIHLDKSGALELENSIASAYGKGHIDSILGANNENVLYTKNNEDIRRLLSKGVQFPQAMADDILARNNLPQTEGNVNVDSLLKLMLGGKRVDNSTASNEQFSALSERGDIGLDAAGRMFQINPAEHIDQRTFDSVGSRKVNAFQFDHPQLHPYFQRAAEAMIADADISQQFGLQRSYERGMQGRKVNQQAQTSAHLRRAMDETGLSRNEIIDAAQRIVNDKGQENVKAAKQVEIILDDMLTFGWQPMMGEAVGPNEAYIREKSEIAGSQPEAAHGEELPIMENDGIGAANAGFDPFTAAQNQYGTQESGENPVRSDDVPVSVDGETKVSHTIVTAKGAQVTPDEFVPLIENETMKGGFSFIPITNDQSVEAAKKYITGRGWPQARADWTADVRQGKAGDQITAIGALLYNNAVNSGDTRATLDILDDYQFAVRISARGLQAARILKTLSPENRLYMIRRSVRRMVEDLKLGEDIQLPDNLVNAYMGAKTDAEVNNAVSDIQQYVADQLPSTLLDMWTALRYVNMLGNFKTQVRNVAGNVGMRAVSTAQNAVATFFETVTGGRFGKTRSVFVDGGLKNAAKQDFQAVREQALSGGKYTLDEANAFAQGVKDKQKVFRGVLAPLEGYRKATNWAMNNQYFGDEGFIKGAYARYLAGYLKANGVTAEQFSDPQWQKANGDFVDKARSFAVQQAQEVTFRDSNTLSDWVSKFGRRSDTPTAVKMVSEGMMPFRKTPANVLLRAEEYSPLGIINTALEAAHKGLSKTKLTERSGRIGAYARSGAEVSGTDIINSLSKTLTGTGIFLAGMALASAGMLRGGGTGDDEQDAFDELTGHQDYSLILEDGTSITLDWLTPASMPLFMGAELERLRQEGGIELKDLESSLTSILEPMIQMSMMQGVNDTLNDLKYAQDANLIQIAATAALGYLTQGLTNSLVGQVSRSTKEESMMTYVDKDSAVPAWLQREIGAASRKVPGEGYNQIPYIDAWGRTEATGDALERSINNLFNPAYVSQVDVDELETELQRLKDATGSASVFPDRAEKSITFDNETHNLTAEQYQKYATTLGQTRYELAKEAMSLADSHAMSDGGKAALLEKMYGYAGYKAKKSVFPEYENSEFAKYAQAEAAGMKPSEYYVMKETYDYDHSSQTGQPTQEEAQRYLDTETDLSRRQKADMWTIINKSWKNNPYA